MQTSDSVGVAPFFKNNSSGDRTYHYTTAINPDFWDFDDWVGTTSCDQGIESVGVWSEGSNLRYRFIFGDQNNTVPPDGCASDKVLFTWQGGSTTHYWRHLDDPNGYGHILFYSGFYDTSTGYAWPYFYSDDVVVIN